MDTVNTDEFFASWISPRCWQGGNPPKAVGLYLRPPYSQKPSKGPKRNGGKPAEGGLYATSAISQEHRAEGRKGERGW